MIKVPHGNIYNDGRTVRMQQPISARPLTIHADLRMSILDRLRVFKLFACPIQLSVKLLIKTKKKLKKITFLDVKLSGVAFILLINS